MRRVEKIIRFETEGGFLDLKLDTPGERVWAHWKARDHKTYENGPLQEGPEGPLSQRMLGWLVEKDGMEMTEEVKQTLLEACAELRLGFPVLNVGG